MSLGMPESFPRAHVPNSAGITGQPIQGTADEQLWIDRILVERMYVAHFRNDHALTRRADLLLLFEVNRDLAAVRLPNVISGWPCRVIGGSRRRCGPSVR